MASTASLVARSPQPPRKSRSSSDAVSRAVMKFSLPHLAASKSYIFRAKRLSEQPHSRIRSLTRSSPKRSTSRFVAVLSETMIDSIARSRSDAASTSRMCRKTPVPSTRSPTLTRSPRSISPRAASAYSAITRGSLITDAAGKTSSARAAKSSPPRSSQANAAASPGNDASPDRAGPKSSTLASLVHGTAADDRYARSMNARYPAVLTLLAIAFAACIPQPLEETPTPTPRATSARPRFELATYMYALQTKGKIRIGVLDKAIPFAVHDSSGLRTGFEVDLGRELAKAIFGPQQDPDSVIEWIPVERTTAVSALIGAQADVTLAQLAAPESGTGFDSPVDLSDPYFVTGERILIRSSNDEIKDLPDLDTKTVCVQRDTAVAEHVVEASAFARTLSLGTHASCLGALQPGQGDAIGADEAILWNLVKLDPNTKLVGRVVTTERYSIGG